jgi:hypothetical protein
MAWTNNSAAIQTPENPAKVAMPTDWLPFDASRHTPMVRENVLAGLVTQAEKTIADERDEDMASIKRNLRSIMSNRLLSEMARVRAASELAKMHDDDELQEMREEVARLKAIIEASADDSEQLPPSLRGRR